ncbi:hypothetical protein ABIE41_000258 [Bosea sp. OAE506]|uniref:hypothetical protein n=1 Tax=Bosea sp. OAE506 TaxID=2663870 RepID=UPI00178B202B
MTDSAQDLPATGPALALALQRRHPGRDWLAALAMAARRPRGDIERYLQEDGVLPPFLRAAAAEVATLLQSQDAATQAAAATDDVFAARTNDADAPMEIDSEAGTIVQPSSKSMPSQSGSEHEMRTKPPKAEKNEEFLPTSGVPAFLSPLRKDEG